MYKIKDEMIVNDIIKMYVEDIISTAKIGEKYGITRFCTLFK